MKLFRRNGKSVLLPLCLSVLMSCGDDKSTQNTTPGDDNSYKETVAETIVFPNAQIVYYGNEFDDGVSDAWRISLYTDMTIDAVGDPIGPGHIMRLSCNATPADDQVAYLSNLAGKYTWQSSDNDFSPNTFNWGYQVRLDLPTGAIYKDDGSFYGKVADGSTEYERDLLKEGFFTIVDKGDDVISISGTMVGEKYKKRYFEFEGKVKIYSEAEQVVPNTTLTSDINLTDLTQARLEDGDDAYVLEDNSYRLFTLMLASKDVDLSLLVPAGTGNVMQVDFFVGWDTQVADGIPAGTYKMTVREANKGIDRTNIIPFNIAPGYPDKFTLPSGSWYFGYENGVMKNYACIKTGTMTVTRDGVGHNISIDFADIDDAAHKVTTSYSTTTAIPTFNRY